MEHIINMLREDGVEGARLSKYRIAILNLEDLAFQNGKAFGAGERKPGSGIVGRKLADKTSGPEDLQKEQEIEFKQSEARSTEDSFF